MKRINYLFLILMAFAAVVSCKKHKILFDVDHITDSDAEFQIFNDLAVRSGEAAEVSRLDCVILNETDTVATSTYPLYQRNAIPAGGTTRFFVRKPGTYSIKAWRTDTLTVQQRAIAGWEPEDKRKLSGQQRAILGFEPDYQGTFTITNGKQTVHIYNWGEDPIVLDGDYPYIRSDRPNTTEYVYFNFINMYQEGDYNTSDTKDHSGLKPTTKRLQYQMRLDNLRSENGPTGKTEWQNIGEPVAFGEQTGFCPVVVPNNGRGFRGGLTLNGIGVYTVTVYTRIVDADTGEEYIGEDYWSSLRLGRYLYHVAFCKNKPANGVMCFQFYAL